jgi:pimeloyl-ACP methyl ester carboxylesterase
VYGGEDRGVVLAHGGRFTKESWDEQAHIVAAAGFRVLAFDFRGHGLSRGPANGHSNDEGRRFDVLASVKYLRNTGAVGVSVIGASMGGDYAAEAAEAEPDLIDRLVLLAAGAYTPLERAKARKLFIMAVMTLLETTNRECPRYVTSMKGHPDPKSSSFLKVPPTLRPYCKQTRETV